MIFFGLVVAACVLLIACYVFGTLAVVNLDQQIGIHGPLAITYRWRAAGWGLGMVVCGAGMICVIARLCTGAWLS